MPIGFGVVCSNWHIEQTKIDCFVEIQQKNNPISSLFVAVQRDFGQLQQCLLFFTLRKLRNVFNRFVHMFSSQFSRMFDTVTLDIIEAQIIFLIHYKN